MLLLLLLVEEGSEGGGGGDKHVHAVRYLFGEVRGEKALALKEL